LVTAYYATYATTRINAVSAAAFLCIDPPSRRSDHVVLGFNKRKMDSALAAQEAEAPARSAHRSSRMPREAD
jgi:hypothetical protein